MQRISGFLLLILLTNSCQWFDTEKISADTFYEEDLKAIDWENVDHYPGFKSCERFTEKQAEKQCFEQEIRAHIYAGISDKKLMTHADLDDTVWVGFTISNTGQVSNVEITIDSLIQDQIPLLASWLEESITNLPSMSPASKRGIPVITEFQLPIVLKSSTD